MRKSTLGKVLLTTALVLGLGTLTPFTAQASTLTEPSTRTIATSGGNRTVTYIEIPLDGTYE